MFRKVGLFLLLVLSTGREGERKRGGWEGAFLGEGSHPRVVLSGGFGLAIKGTTSWVPLGLSRVPYWRKGEALAVALRHEGGIAKHRSSDFSLSLLVRLGVSTSSALNS